MPNDPTNPFAPRHWPSGTFEQPAPAWPDPERPGVPLNPERDGWHWLLFRDGSRLCCYWVAAQEAWASADKYQPDYQPDEAAEDHVGCEPCLTPSEVAARVAEAVAGERERCAKVAEAYAEHGNGGEVWVARRIIDAIRAGGAG